MVLPDPKSSCVWIFAWLCVADETGFHCLVSDHLECCISCLSLPSAGVTGVCAARSSSRCRLSPEFALRSQAVLAGRFGG